MKDPSLANFKEIIQLKFDLNNKANELQIKETERRLDLIEKSNELKFRELSLKIEQLQKMVYIGIGGILALQIVLKFIV